MSDKVKDLTAKVAEQKKNIERRTFNIKELAQVMDISENAARQLCKSKGFPSMKVGRKILIPITRFEEWLNNSVGQEF